MAHTVGIHFGSGLLPGLVDYHPQLKDTFPTGTFPSKTTEGVLTHLNVDPVAVLNPEDWSVHFGIRDTVVEVGGTPVLLVLSPLENRRAVAIQNLGPGILYIGRSDVTTGRGYPIDPNSNKEIAIDAKGTIRLYGVSASSSDVRILELA